MKLDRKIDVESVNLSDSLKSEFNSVLTQITKKDGVSIYKSKSKNWSALSCYVWREVAFLASDNYQHHSAPVTAEFDLLEHLYNTKQLVKTDVLNETLEEKRIRWEKTDAIKAEYKKFSEIILNHIDNSNLPGLRRWKNAFGV
jgi:hypothetical protein